MYIYTHTHTLRVKLLYISYVCVCEYIYIYIHPVAYLKLTQCYISVIVMTFNILLRAGITFSRLVTSGEFKLY